MSAQSKKTLSQIGEFGLIDLLAKNFSCRNATLGIGDDAAILPAPSQNKQLLLTTDMLAEGVHFPKNLSAEHIGYKALACNLSDIAAMGGIPRFAVVSLAVPANLNVGFVQEIYAGISSLAKRFQVEIVGGDTIRGEKIVINVALLGEVERGKQVLRSTAKAGDFIFVTGPLGRSLRTGKHFSFTPRLKESSFLVKHYHPTSMIDISDGLAADLGHILQLSNQGAVIYEKLIPRTPGSGLKQALCDGEDFELLFTLKPQEAKRLMLFHKKGLSFFCIGQIIDEKGILILVDDKGSCQSVPLKGFSHF